MVYILPLLGPVGLAIAYFMLQRWRFGVFLLLLYLPFAGGIALKLNSSTLKLAKDIFFVIPCFFACMLNYREFVPRIKVPPIISICSGFFLVMVIVQMFNPKGYNLLVGAVGLKVWVLYIPLIYVGSAFIDSKKDIIFLFRFLAIVAWIPCIVGLIQWVGSEINGYVPFMTMFYGPGAKEATHNFETFTLGTTFYRIPSTFAYVTHYFGFLFSMIIPVYSLMALESSRKWKIFAQTTLLLIIVSALFSGARIVYLFFPLIFGIIVVLEGKLKTLARVALFGPGIVLTTLTLGGLDADKIFALVIDLFFGYSDSVASRHLEIAYEVAPWGFGTGVNTAASRFVGDHHIYGLESYYSKAVMELGVPGLIVLGGLLVAILFVGYEQYLKTDSEEGRTIAATLLAFIVSNILNNFKGFGMDWDPLNIYFWLFVGLLFKLPAVQLSKDPSPAPLSAPAKEGSKPHFGAPLPKRPPLRLIPQKKAAP